MLDNRRRAVRCCTAPRGLRPQCRAQPAQRVVTARLDRADGYAEIGGDVGDRPVVDVDLDHDDSVPGGEDRQDGGDGIGRVDLVEFAR